MAREQLQNLTEPMYYVLIALIDEECGIDIMQKVVNLSKGRIKVGPGTLYALLGRFEKEGIIKETKVVARKRNYIITDKGKDILREEYERLKSLVLDGEMFINF